MRREKILVFHLFISDDFDTNCAYRIHSECMKCYKDVFTEVRFTISVPDINDKERIKKGIRWIMGIGFNVPLTIKVVKNEPLYEADTLVNEVLDKLDSFDGLVFFAHGKGIANFIEDKIPGNVRNIKSIARWITSIYYTSLNFIDEVEDKLFGLRGDSEVFYGGSLQYVEDWPNKTHYFYPGTFYWLNPMSLKQRIDDGRIVLPIVKDRYFAEALPGNVCDRVKWGDGLSSHGDKAANQDFDLYMMGDDKWEIWCKVMDVPDFMTFSDNVLNKAGFYDRK